MTDEIQSRLEMETGDCFVDKPKTYIGDGVYAFFDEFSILLATDRSNGVHWLALEPQVLAHLIQFSTDCKNTKPEE